MMTKVQLNDDARLRTILNSPEASVLSHEDERTLLIELVQCKERILESSNEPFSTSGNGRMTVEEFQQHVRDLLESSARYGRSPDLVTLARRYQQIRGLLAMANVRLVAHIARWYGNRGVSHSDLIQEGFCGLLQAIDRFDPSNASRLATYAIWWVRQSIQRAIARTAYPVRLDPKQLRRLAKLCREASDERQDSASASHEFRDQPRLSQTTLSLLAAVRPRVSLDSPRGHNSGNALSEILSLPYKEEPEDFNIEEFISSMIGRLGPREQLVLQMRFGLGGQPRHSLSQVSQVLSVSKERIRQIQDRALEKLREFAEQEGTTWPN
jgi:RNA polymerase primary sigma factor